MKNLFYLAYSLTLLGGLGLAEYRGWSLLSVNEVKQIPKSVRDNPGSYRSIYRSHPHYFGGK